MTAERPMSPGIKPAVPFAGSFVIERMSEDRVARHYSRPGLHFSLSDFTDNGFDVILLVQRSDEGSTGSALKVDKNTGMIQLFSLDPAQNGAATGTINDQMLAMEFTIGESLTVFGNKSILVDDLLTVRADDGRPSGRTLPISPLADTLHAIFGKL